MAKAIEMHTFEGEYEVLYEFEPIEIIKGTVKTNFTIIGHPKSWKNPFGDFTNHTEERFWKNSWGRVSNDEDCEIHPKFTKGMNYLIFLNRPYHNKSFEEIHDVESDKWLRYVKKEVSKDPHQQLLLKLESTTPSESDKTLYMDIVGSWVKTNSPKVVMSFDYKQDSTFKRALNYLPDAKLSFEYGGQWSVKNNHLISSTDYCTSKDFLSPPRVYIKKIISITEDEFNYQSLNGNNYTRKKINPNQKLDLTVKTPVESGNVQGTAGQL